MNGNQLFHHASSHRITTYHHTSNHHSHQVTTCHYQAPYWREHHYGSPNTGYFSHMIKLSNWSDGGGDESSGGGSGKTLSSLEKVLLHLRSVAQLQVRKHQLQIQRHKDIGSTVSCLLTPFIYPLFIIFYEISARCDWCCR